MTERLILGIVTAALGAVVALTMATTAGAARPLEVALQDDTLLVYQSPYGFGQSFPQLRQLHVSWIRVNVIWANVLGGQAHARKKPKHVKYAWGAYDNTIANAAANGIQVELTLTGPAPVWASGNKRIGGYRPNAALFRAFAHDAAAHFAGRVTRYSIWNEPNYVAWLSPQAQAPKLYRALYQAGYASVKGVSRDNQVLFGETSPYASRGRSLAPLDFLRRSACVDARYRRGPGCAPLRADGVAHHPYDFRHKPTYRYPGADNVTLATLGRMNAALKRLAKAHALLGPTGGGIPPIYLTEYGYFSSGKYRVPLAKQAAYLKQAFTIALHTPNVRQMLQYLLVTPPKKLRFFDSSIVRLNGRPLPAFNALKSWAAAAARSGAITSPKGP